MKINNKLKLNLQHFASIPEVKPQEFNPDNVLMHEKKEGELLNNFTKPILLDVMDTSKIMQLGKFQDMNGTEKTFTYWADQPGAYWVGEGQKIQTSKATWLEAHMRAFKLAVILPVTKEFLDYTYTEFFEEVKPMLVQAFAQKFDDAGILNINNPFGVSIQQSVDKTGKTVKGDINQENIIQLEGLLEDDDFEANAFISKRQNRSKLRQIVDAETKERIYDKQSNTLDGLPVVDIKNSNFKRNQIFAGDFNKLFYGIPQQIKYSISDSAQISTVKNGDGSEMNLWEQDMMALKATMHVAVLIADDNAFSKLDATEASASQPASETV
ncbi:phage major capsid protein [Staphylococcus epidermidis]|uniref:phage major capsid protein n=1 Tax=Staphylococcus epidermidis TaxID=1282 RepID=UPI001EEE97D4|nr:phage major capsid protein [Staphylococcus epidermidis]MCF7581268.1 phage major capsid protein [Staphylococcus epidermidis]